MSQLNSIPFGQSSATASATSAKREYVGNAPSALSTMTGAEIAAWASKHPKERYLLLRVPLADAAKVKAVTNTFESASGQIRSSTDLFGIDLSLDNLDGTPVILRAFSGFGKKGPWAKLVVSRDDYVSTNRERPTSDALA